MINFNRIQSDLFVGTYPQNRIDLDRLKRMRATAVFNLQTDDDLQLLNVDLADLQSHCHDIDLVLARCPIRDFDPTDLQRQLPAAVDSLARLLDVGHRVYLHCTAGVGRAPAVAIAYLAWHRELTIDDAYAHVRRERPCNPFLDAIKRAHDERARP